MLNIYFRWNYCYLCILEDIQRKHRNWSWDHMKAHRNTCRQYKKLYKLKAANQKMSQEQVRDLEFCEQQLDVFNITLARKQAEMEVS